MNINRTLALLTSVLLLSAATKIEAADFTATTPGNWALGDTWGNPGDNVAGSGYPTTGDNATINPGVVVLVTAAAACANLTVDGTLAANNALTVSGTTVFSATGAYNCTTATGTRTFTGDVQLASGSTWSSTVAGPCSFGGGFINNAASFAGNGTYTFTGVAKTISGATATALTALTIGTGASSTLDAASTLTVSGTTTLTGSFANNGTMTINTTSGSGTLTQGTNASLTITQSNGSTPPIALAASATGNTVTYSGSGAPIKSAAYHNLTLSGSGNASATWASITVDGTLTIGGTVVANNFSGTFGTLIINGGSPTANLAVNVSNNLVVSSGTFYAQSGPLTVGGATTVNGGTLRLGNAATFTGDYTLSSGVHTNTGNGAVNFGGNVTVSSVFVGGTGLHTYSGTGKTINGAYTNASVAVAGTYSVSGSLVVNTLLKLNSGGLTSAANVTLANAATITRDTGTLDVAPTFGTIVNLSYGGSTAATTGPEVPTSTTGLNTFTVTNTSAGGITLGANITANGASSVGTASLAAKLNVPTTMEIKSTLSINASSSVAVSSTGTLKNSGTSSITSTAATLTFASGATYQHNPPSGAGTIPTAGWNIGSTCKITGALANAPGGLAQVFGNFTWDTTTQSSAVGLAGALTNISGTLTVANTGSGLSVRLASTQSPTVNIGALIVTGGELNFSSGTGAPTVNVAGDVTLNGGTLRPGTSSGVPVFYVSGNWVNNGGTFTPGTGTVRFNGVSAQNLGGSTETTFNGLAITNSAGVTLGTNATVNGTLALGNGLLNTVSHYVSLGASGVTAGASSAGYVNGTLQKAFNTGSGQTFAFPIGDAAVYAPVSLANLDVTGADTLTATTTGSQHPQIATSGINPAKDVQRYWTLTPGGGLTVSTYDATFDFAPGDVIGGANPANFIVQLYSGGSWSATTTGALTATSSQATGLSAFGDFAVGEVTGGGGPTPTGSSIASTSLAGNILTLTITNGLPSGVFHLLQSANLQFNPFTTNQSGAFNGSGNATVTVTNTGGIKLLRVAEPTP